MKATGIEQHIVESVIEKENRSFQYFPHNMRTSDFVI